MRLSSPRMRTLHRHRRGVETIQARTSTGVPCPSRPLLHHDREGRQFQCAPGSSPCSRRSGRDPLPGGLRWPSSPRGAKGSSRRGDPPMRSVDHDSFSHHSSSDVPQREPDSPRRRSPPKERSTPPTSTPGAPQGGVQALFHGANLRSSKAAGPRPCRSSSPRVVVESHPSV
jgi:hypothetical protein